MAFRNFGWCSYRRTWASDHSTPWLKPSDVWDVHGEIHCLSLAICDVRTFGCVQCLEGKWWCTMINHGSLRHNANAVQEIAHPRCWGEDTYPPIAGRIEDSLWSQFFNITLFWRKPTIKAPHAAWPMPPLPNMFHQPIQHYVISTPD